MTIIKCRNCGQAMKVEPIGTPANNGKVKTLESAAGLFTSPDTHHGEHYYLPDEQAQRPWWEVDAIAFVTAGFAVGGGVWFLFWWLGFSKEIGGSLAALTMIAVIVTFHILRLRWRSPSPPAPDETKIKIEMSGHDPENSKTLLIEYIEDDRIKLAELQRVAYAIKAGSNFSRYALVPRARISNPAYGRILAEFRRLGFAQTDAANQTNLTRGGRAFLRQITKEK